MPELPEVETVANGVDARVRGQRIERVWTSGKPQTFKSSETEIAETLTGAKIDRVRRVGKSIVMDLGRKGKSAGAVPGASGDDGEAAGLPGGSAAAVAYPCGAVAGGWARGSVCRSAAVWTAVGGDRGGRLCGAREQSLRRFRWRIFRSFSKGRKLAIKAALLNQSILHGVGNIYADESLFRAGIRPRKQAGRLTKAELVAAACRAAEGAGACD